MAYHHLPGSRYDDSSPGPAWYTPSGGVFFQQSPPDFITYDTTIVPEVVVRKPVDLLDANGQPRTNAPMSAVLVLKDIRDGQLVSGPHGTPLFGNTTTGTITQSGSGRRELYHEFRFPYLKVLKTGDGFTLQANVSSVDSDYESGGNACSGAFTVSP